MAACMACARNYKARGGHAGKKTRSTRQVFVHMRTPIDIDRSSTLKQAFLLAHSRVVSMANKLSDTISEAR